MRVQESPGVNDPRRQLGRQHRRGRRRDDRVGPQLLARRCSRTPAAWPPDASVHALRRGHRALAQPVRPSRRPRWRMDPREEARPLGVVRSAPSAASVGEAGVRRRRAPRAGKALPHPARSRGLRSRRSDLVAGVGEGAARCRGPCGRRRRRPRGCRRGPPVARHVFAPARSPVSWSGGFVRGRKGGRACAVPRAGDPAPGWPPRRAPAVRCVDRARYAGHPAARPGIEEGEAVLDVLASCSGAACSSMRSRQSPALDEPV